MKSWYSFTIPHLIFVTLLASVAVIGISRIRSQIATIEHDRNEMLNALAVLDQCKAISEEVRKSGLLGETDLPTYKASVRHIDLIIRSSSKYVSKSNVSFYKMAQQADELSKSLPTLQTVGLLDYNSIQIIDFYNRKSQESLIETIKDLTRNQIQVEKRLTSEAVVAFIIVILMSILYLYSVNWFVARPYKKLSETAQTVAKGNLHARASVNLDGPFGDLAMNFNLMVDELVLSLAAEEKIVQELKKKAVELEEANKHKTRFLANVSHELKTPLNAIIGLADILQAGTHGKLSDRQEDYIRRIMNAGDHLLAMIHDLIDLAKMDVGALSIDNKIILIEPSLDESLEIILPQLEEKGHTLKVDKAKDLKIDADPIRLRQVCINLLSNAVKFTAEEGQITVRTLELDGKACIEVEDNGIGISKENQLKVFEEFVQLDSRLHREHEGTGIGLSLSKRLVELMNGELIMESQEGKGTCFRILFAKA